MRNNRHHLVLFDIDGTLLDVRRAGRRAFIETLKRHYDIEDSLEWLTFAGCTDRGILRRIFQRSGHWQGDETLLDEFFGFYPSIMETLIDPDLCTCFPGVSELLGELHGLEQVRLGLVTGNVREGAFIKLRSVGLNGYFEEGGFGDDHEDRNELARLARDRFTAKYGKPARIILVGDAPADVQAAKSIGAFSITVGTSIFSRQELLDAGSDLHLETLENIPEFLKLLE